MNTSRLATITAVAVLGLSPSWALAQTPAPAPAAAPMAASADGKPPLSPPADAATTVEGRDVKVTYSAPSMRGRKIMGALVPYDKVWRTGANAATTFYTEDTLKVGDLTVKAGTYTLYTLPAAPGTPWKLIVNKQTGQWGTVYTESMDLGRATMKSATLTTPQETMTISFENRKKSECELHIRWETTDVWVKLEPPPTEMMFIPKKHSTTATSTTPAPPPTP
jgi:hypothetical protein